MTAIACILVMIAGLETGAPAANPPTKDAPAANPYREPVLRAKESISKGEFPESVADGVAQRQYLTAAIELLGEIDEGGVTRAIEFCQHWLSRLSDPASKVFSAVDDPARDKELRRLFAYALYEQLLTGEGTNARFRSRSKRIIEHLVPKDRLKKPDDPWWSIGTWYGAVPISQQAIAVNVGPGFPVAIAHLGARAGVVIAIEGGGNVVGCYESWTLPEGKREFRSPIASDGSFQDAIDSAIITPEFAFVQLGKGRVLEIPADKEGVARERVNHPGTAVWAYDEVDKRLFAVGPGRRIWDTHNGEFRSLCGDYGFETVSASASFPSLKGIAICYNNITGMPPPWLELVDDNCVVKWEFKGFESRAKAMAGHDATARIAAVDRDNLYLFDAHNGEVIAKTWHEPQQDEAIAISPDGRFVLSCGKYGAIYLQDMKDLRTLFVFAGHRSNDLRLGWASDSKSFVSLGRDQSLRLWNIPESILQTP